MISNGFRKLLEINIITLISIILLLALIGYYMYTEYLFIDRITSDSLNKSIEGYISDEIWYVDASRNILHKIFRVDPSTPCGECYTIFLHENSTVVTPAIFDIAARKTGVEVIDRYFETKDKPFMFLYVRAKNRSHVELYINELKKYGVITRDYVRGWIYGKAYNIDKYLNTEHPPLAKYFIALSMILLGDYPFNWRIPSMLSGLLILILAYIITREILKERYKEYSSIIALIPVLLLTIDPIHKYMSSIALLDIYVGASTLIAFYVFIRTRKENKRILATTIASTLKFTGLFLALSHLLEVFLWDRYKRFSDRVLSALYLVIRYFIVFLIIQFIVSIPLILYLGPLEWFNQAIPGAFRWHTSIKHEIGRGPVVSTPLDWVLGRNSFVLYYWSNGEPLYARGAWYFYLLSVLIALFLTPLAVTDRTYRKAWLGLVGVYGGYILLWVLGGRTQYSYYLAHIAPFFYINLVVGLACILPKDFPVNYKRGLTMIKRLLSLERYYSVVETEKLIGLTMILLGIGLSSVLHAPWIEPRIYSDVYSVYWMIYGSPDQWYGPQLTYGIPYIDYRFLYMPGHAWVFLFTTMTRLFLGYDKYLGIDKGFYAYYILNTIISLIAAYIILDDMIFISRRFSRSRRIPLYIYAILPSMIIYGVYSWDIIALMAIVRSFRFFIEGNYGLTGLFTGVASLFNPLYSLILLVYIVDIGRKAGSMVRLFILSILVGHSLLILNPSVLVDVYNSFFGHYIEGSWLLLLTDNPSDPIVINVGWFIAIIAGLVIILAPSRDHGFENAYGKLVLLVSIASLLSPLYKPQYNLVVASLWIPILEIIYTPILVLQDMSASMVILTWFTGNPMYKYSVPQLANYSKCVLLAVLIMYNIGRYIDLSRIRKSMERFREMVSYKR